MTIAVGLLAIIAVPALSSAQTATAQLVIITKTDGYSPVPTSAPLIVVNATGPSLTTTPTSSGTLTYASSFNSDTRVVTVIPGTYSAAAQSGSTYSFAYSTQCSGYVSANETRTCTITATAGGTSRVNVAVNVINHNGGSRTANDFVITINGVNPSITSIQGSAGSTQISMGPGAYSIDVSSAGSYQRTRSVDCSGTILSGETKSCSITLEDTNPYYYNGTYLGRTPLSCAPANQTAYQGSTISFNAVGGSSGSYTWATADRVYLSTGSSLNVYLQTLGSQAVYVNSGYETAKCMVTVLAGTGTNAYTNYVPTTVTANGSVVLGSYTTAPGLPNTGYAPSNLGLILALIGTFIALPFTFLVSYRYARETASTFFR